MITALLQAIAAIPALIKAIGDLTAWFQKAQDEKWFQQSNQAFKPLEQGPTTPEQKDQAAKDIADLIHKL